MAKFDKIAVLNKIGSTGMIPVFYHEDVEIAKKVVKACYEGGVRAFEFTNRGDFAQEVFSRPGLENLLSVNARRWLWESDQWLIRLLQLSCIYNRGLTLW